MKRYLCWLAVFAVLAVPDWASACRPLFGRAIPRPVYVSPVQCAPAYPIYHPPVYGYELIYPHHPQPAPQAKPLQPPRVETSPKTATPSPAPAPKGDGMGAGNPGSVRSPATEVVRPVAGSDAVPPEKNPVTPPMNPDPKKAAPPKVEQPELLPKFPEVEIPKNIGPLPKLDLPKANAQKEPDFRATPTGAGTEPPKKTPAPPIPEPDLSPKLPPIEFTKDSDPKLPKLDLPKDNDPKLPKLDLSGATAAPAPAPAFPEPLIPSPSVPVIPDPAKPESLPSLTLPPDVPLKKESTSKSSPLTGGAREVSVSVFPVAAAERPVGGYRTVGFYNHTARDLNLTIEGRAVKLPARSYLHAQLARTFTWGRDDQPAARQTVPDGSAGMDVVFRD